MVVICINSIHLQLFIQAQFQVKQHNPEFHQQLSASGN
jgi:hypothetical protein